MRYQRFKAFTLSELLITLAILGVIATFTIPKVLQAQQDGKKIALAKEAMSTVAQAYQAYKLQNQPSATFEAQMLTPYMNYIKEDTVTILEYGPYGWVAECSFGNVHCVTFANGGVMSMQEGAQFGNTTTTNTVAFIFDPDGKQNGTADGRAIVIQLYYNGRIMTAGTILDPSEYNDTISAGMSLLLPDPDMDPPWWKL